VDLAHAFRACRRHNNTKACFYIYTAMDLVAEAVDLALGEAVAERAVREVEKMRDADPPVDEDVQQKLWLRILRHYIGRRGDVSAAISLLRRVGEGGERIVHVDNVLPYCDDSILIGGFEGEIRRALGRYHARIESLNDDIREHTDSARAARSEMQLMHEGMPSPWYENRRCDLSGRSLRSCRRFFVFPCTHAFDFDVLLADFLGCPEATKGHHVLAFELQERIARHDAAPRRGSIAAAEHELAGTVAQACPLCGVHALARSSQQQFGSRLENAVVGGSESAAWEL